ncbi:hypothetical protein ONS95_004328 [Cadophora gregata]|uniref:uncharacterized protein n=1 Tax=Cadophora gregata TaxID=51156 RepID=UPI0026DCD1D9|nr:uncharacterized protein ONS95_004328 [Cadophora gregata]KAK0105288.1 hypothetical protein ONS96_004684 [Cadophora gregata f. sp. sojae]KAK0105811.1 hypothetical protein ONS95_004328 [Cadophora gregata]
MTDDQPLLVHPPPLLHVAIEAENMALPSLVMSWSILFAASGMMWGIFLIYDIPASLSTPLQHHLSLSDGQYGYLVAALYTAYAAPNFILPCICGFVANQYGQKRILISSLAIVVLGQAIFAASLQGGKKGSWGLVVGRVFVGIGSETPGVIASGAITRWLHGRTLALALAILLCISRLGSVATSILTPRLTEEYGVIAATWMSTCLAWAVTLPCATYLVLVDVDIAAEKSKPLALSNYTNSLRRFPRVFWILAIICTTSYGCLGSFNNSAQRFLSSIFYQGDERAAGLAVSIPNTLSGVLVIPFGLFLDHPRLKNYPVAIAFSSGLLLIAHLCFLFQIRDPGLSLVALGVGYASFGTAFWPAVASCILDGQAHIPESEPLSSLVTDHSYEQEQQNLDGTYPEIGHDSDVEIPSLREEHLPGMVTNNGNEDLVVIGYGITTSLLNLSMGVVPIILAGMELLAGFTGTEMVFVALAGISLCASGKLINDWKEKRI